MDEYVLDTLIAIRKRITKPGSWCKGTLWHEGPGPKGLKNVRVSWCLKGAAIEERGTDSVIAIGVLFRLRDFSHKDWPIPRINDEESVEHQHILDWLDAVIRYESKRLKKPVAAVHKARSRVRLHEFFSRIPVQ